MAVRWEVFAAAEPEMAEAGHGLIYQFGVGLGFMATVRADGGPRMHPFCLSQFEGGLWGFINDSPKRRDLLRDGRVALHSLPPEKTDSEFYVTGRAVLREHEAELRAKILALHTATGVMVGEGEWLFEFEIENVLWAHYETRPQWPPVYRKWKAPK